MKHYQASYLLQQAARARRHAQTAVTVSVLSLVLSLVLSIAAVVIVFSSR